MPNPRARRPKIVNIHFIADAKIVNYENSYNRKFTRYRQASSRTDTNLLNFVNFDKNLLFFNKKGIYLHIE